MALWLLIVSQNKSNFIMSSFKTTNIEKQLSDLGKEIQNFVEKLIPVDQPVRDFTPACDVVEGKDVWKIFVDLPGMKKEQVSLTLKNRVLTIEGERELYLEDGESLEREERKQGAFIRSFAIPEYADESSVEASFKDGVLKIEISKKEDGEGPSGSIPIN